MQIMKWMLMPLRRYAEFSGRSRRKEYWMYILFLIIVAIVIAIVEALLGLNNMMGDNGPISAIFSLATLIPSLAVAVRRLHDTERSGWWILLPVLPYAIVIVGIVTMSNAAMAVGGFAAFASVVTLLVFMCLEGTNGPNRFGPNPKGADHAEVFA